MASDWLRTRGRGVHLTIRDIDCRDFDAERLAKDLHDLHVNVLSFFCAGYVTVHPTSLSLRISPFLNGRDLTGEIVDALHRYGIKAVAAMDLSLIPETVANEHPDWLSLDASGEPYRANRDLGNFYIACPHSGYQNEYLELVLRELVSRYDLDGIKFGGGSYGFTSYGNGICHCSRCREAYRAFSGREIPLKEDPADPAWVEFQRWRQEAVVQRTRFLYQLVKSLNPDLPVMCNSVCFGDPDWTIRGALDIERMAENIDAVQVEAQTRIRVDGDHGEWQFLLWPSEEASFLTNVSDHQIWVLASYFQAWPWRRNAVPPAEQKIYMAQMYANGGSAIVNLSGGPPAVHQDQRGFAAIRSLYEFVERNADYYDGDASAADVAVVYSQNTLFNYDREEPKRYVDAIRGVEQALAEHHIPFDVISDRLLIPERLAKYRTVVLPSTACMTEEAAESLRKYVENGGSVVATFETSLYGPDGRKRDDFLLADLLGVSRADTVPVTGKQNGVYKQAYLKVRHKDHPLLADLGDTTVIPAANRYCRVRLRGEKAEVPLTLSAAFRVFPEGMSYTTDPDPDDPMLIAKEHPSGGRTVYFAGQPDLAFLRFGYPDWGLLLANAVRWASGGRVPLEAEAPSTLLVTLRKQDNRRLVHLVNLNGGRRMFRQMIPACDVKILLRSEPAFRPHRAFLLSDLRSLPMAEEKDGVSVRIPRVEDYDVLVIEGEPDTR